MRESQSCQTSTLARALRLALLLALPVLAILPARSETAPDSDSITDPDWEYYRPRPLFIWFTPAAGLFGKIPAAGADLRFALENGWGASAGLTYGEELCIYCNSAMERFGAGALLAGIRGVGRFGYASIAAGPNWGWESGPDPDFVPTLEDDIDCDDFFCRDNHPTVSNEGWGVQIQMQATLAGKYLGIGGQIQVIYIPQHVYAGASLIVPVGLIK